MASGSMDGVGPAEPGFERRRRWVGMIGAACAALVALVIFAGVPTGPTRAGELATTWREIPNGRLRLVAGGADGAAALAGLEIELAPGWKTYWRTPGDTGVPPNLDFTRSTNLASARVLYPAPRRYPEPGGETIGYKSAVTFPIRIVAKDGGAPVGLALALEIGVCERICIPVEAQLALTVPPASSVAAIPVALREALARVPRAQRELRSDDPRLVSTVASLAGAKPQLTFTAAIASGGADADAFIEAPDGLWLPQPRVVSRAGETVRFEVDLSDGVDLAAIVGKPVRITLVSAAGASEASWTLPTR
jgi:DsbC/DsbD-like thiol-disulfide interchange protein